MTTPTAPAVPANAYRVTITLDHPEPRLDNILLDALRKLEDVPLKNISRSGLKDLFNQKKIMIKGQRAKSSSSLAKGTTYIDIVN
jgi:hypothetical protein